MISFPWDSIVTGFDEETGFPRYDRTYKAEELREVLKTFFSNGVFLQDSEAFVVTPNEGMSVLVSSGRCFIQGDVGVEQSTRELLLQAPSSQDRIDTIVLRWDANIDARSIDIYVREGVASSTPVRPTLTRTESVWELGVADIYIAKNTQSVAAQRITDTRLETSRCGAVTPFATIDTTTFYNQIQAAIDARMAELQEQTQTAVDLAQSALDGTIAGNLQTQIDIINTYLPKEKPEPEWVSHRNAYRGKYLGSEYTEDQKLAISSGTFDDIYVGDYWTINGIDWMVADVNYWMGTFNGESSLEQNHLVIVPRVNLYQEQMYDTSTTASGYLGSKMYKSGLDRAKSTIYEAFGEDNVLKHQNRFTNACNGNGTATGASWLNSKVDLMNQPMVYGHYIFESSNNAGVVPETGTIDTTQLALFRLKKSAINKFPSEGTQSFWLRDVVSSTMFATCGDRGYAGWNRSDNTSQGVRPAFGLIG